MLLENKNRHSIQWNQTQHQMSGYLFSQHLINRSKMFDIITQYSNIWLHKHYKYIPHILLGTTKRFPGIPSILSELFLDSQDLVVFGQTFRTTRSTGFNLSRGQPNHKISDERILSFSGSVRHHRSPTGFLGSEMSIDCFGNWTNLVHLTKRVSHNNIDRILNN